MTRHASRDRNAHHHDVDYERNKDYSARYGRTHTIGGHRYEDANAPYASGSGRKIYATTDYDDEYLARRLRRGR